jgi:hypothetical protein
MCPEQFYWICSRVKVEEGAFDGTAPVDKEAPNFEVSGKLLEDTNTFNGVIVKYSEPPEARKPKRRWRFYVFKGDESLPTLHIHRQSAFLVIIRVQVFDQKVVLFSSDCIRDLGSTSVRVHWGLGIGTSTVTETPPLWLT